MGFIGKMDKFLLAVEGGQLSTIIELLNNNNIDFDEANKKVILLQTGSLSNKKTYTFKNNKKEHK